MGTKFVALDGIRGAAAVFVLAHHTPALWQAWPYRAYLAVDVFFLLSGFVIAHSYEARLASASLSTRRFIALRLIRLYPMYLLSMAFSVGSVAMKTAASGAGTIEQAASLALHGLFMLPTLDGPSLFPLNGVFWSLFCELVINVLYVYCRSALTERILKWTIATLAVALACLAYSTGAIDFGHQGGALGLFGGLTRAAFGILLGVALYRHRESIWARLPLLPGPFFALGIICLIFGTAPAGGINWLVDLVAVVCVFPVSVMLASRTTPAHGLRTMTILGLASYPLYLLHPIFSGVAMKLAPQWIAANRPIAGWMFAAVMVGLSLAAELYFDQPIRRWLARRLPIQKAPDAKVAVVSRARP